MLSTDSIAQEFYYFAYVIKGLNEDKNKLVHCIDDPTKMQLRDKKELEIVA